MADPTETTPRGPALPPEPGAGHDPVERFKNATRGKKTVRKPSKRRNKPKTARSVALFDTVWANLDHIADFHGVPRSAVFDKIVADGIRAYGPATGLTPEGAKPNPFDPLVAGVNTTPGVLTNLSTHDGPYYNGTVWTPPNGPPNGPPPADWNDEPPRRVPPGVPLPSGGPVAQPPREIENMEERG